MKNGTAGPSPLRPTRLSSRFITAQAGTTPAPGIIRANTRLQQSSIDREENLSNSVVSAHCSEEDEHRVARRSNIPLKSFLGKRRAGVPRILDMLPKSPLDDGAASEVNYNPTKVQD